MSKDNPLLSVVVPVYNEQEVIAETAKRLRGVLDGMSVDYEIVFVNDGSRDGTLSVLRPLCEADARLKLVNFSRNFGHQIAITAGMDMTRGDAVVVIDADLQDPPEVIPGMFERWKQGYEVVYGKRLSREGETFFKKFTAKVFYRFMARMTEVDMPVDTGDFRLLDRKVVDALRRTPERNRYVRGIVSWLGFKQCAYEYERHERFAGQTKYPPEKNAEARLRRPGILFRKAPALDYGLRSRPVGPERAVPGLYPHRLPVRRGHAQRGPVRHAGPDRAAARRRHGFPGRTRRVYRPHLRRIQSPSALPCERYGEYRGRL